MMTFLIMSDFVENATYLDNRRLGKQRIEGVQILDALKNGTGWRSHPITKSWEGHEAALKYYINCIIREWVKRGFQNSIPEYDLSMEIIVYPWWVFWNRLHQSHRAMLLRKDPTFYQGKFEVEPEYLCHGYIWPNKVEKSDIDSPLEKIADPIPKDLINARFCPALLKSGKRQGESCGILLKGGQTSCKKHGDDTPDRFCPVLLKSGQRQGEPCNIKLKEGQDVCGRHAKTN